MFDMKDFNKKRDDFDKDFSRMQTFMYAWFVFVALVAVGVLAGIVFVVYRLMVTFGIM